MIKEIPTLVAKTYQLINIKTVQEGFLSKKFTENLVLVDQSNSV
jgi:hypothetical protein